MAGSMFVMATMNSVTMAAISLMIFGVGLGFGMTVFTTAAQNSAPESQLGVVTATCTLFRNLGGTIFIAIFGSIMNTSMASKLQSLLTSGSALDLSQLDPATALKFKSLANPQLLLDKTKLTSIQAGLPQQAQDLFLKMMDMVKDSMGSALSTVFFIGAMLLVGGVVISLFLNVKHVPEDKADIDELGQS